MRLCACYGNLYVGEHINMLDIVVSAAVFLEPFLSIISPLEYDLQLTSIASSIAISFAGRVLGYPMLHAWRNSVRRSSHGGLRQEIVTHLPPCLV